MIVQAAKKKRLGACCTACARSSMQGFGDDGEVAVASSVGASTAAGSATQNPIFIGTATGVLIWTVTRVLDRLFGGK